MEGFQKPASQPGAKSVSLAFIRYQGTTAICTCGWVGSAERLKVLNKSIDKHVNKQHNGQAVYL